jgi:hypothetical protein
MESMNQGKSSPLLDTVNDLLKQFAILYSLFYTEYDGGDFCQGLITAKELASVFWYFGKSMLESMTRMPEPSQFEPKTVSQETKVVRQDNNTVSQ